VPRSPICPSVDEPPIRALSLYAPCGIADIDAGGTALGSCGGHRQEAWLAPANDPMGRAIAFEIADVATATVPQEPCCAMSARPATTVAAHVNTLVRLVYCPTNNWTIPTERKAA